MPRIDCIISGGQTGADQGGLSAAKDLGLLTGGYAPKGYRTETGPAPWLAELDVLEHDSPEYPPRTHENVRLSDGTVIFGNRSQGSNLTERYCMDLKKPYIWLLPIIDPKRKLALRGWLAKNNISILNVAGNRESKNPGIAEKVKAFLVYALKEQ